MNRAPSGWYELTQKKEHSQAEKAAIAAVIALRVGAQSNRTMEQIFDELLGTWEHIFSHCKVEEVERGE